MPIDDTRAAELAAEAAALARNAYAPYSGFHVGAVALTRDGRTFGGVNMENASYGLTACAEVSALAAAATAGAFAEIETIAVIGGRSEGGVLVGEEPVFPCGRCRQLIFEIASLRGGDVDILCFSGDEQNMERTSIRVLLPNAFGPATIA